MSTNENVIEFEGHKLIYSGEIGSGPTFVCYEESMGFGEAEYERWNFCPACGAELEDT